MRWIPLVTLVGLHCAVAPTPTLPTNPRPQPAPSTSVVSPRVVDDRFVAAEVAVDDRDLSCARSIDRRVACWGRHRTHPDDIEDIGTGTPFVIDDLAGAVAIDVNEGEVCVIIEGRVRCWSSFRGLYDVVGLEGAIDIDGSSNGFCAVRDDGTVHCWGWVQWLEGAASMHDGLVEATPVPGALGVEHLACVRDGCCSLGDSSQCWGSFDQAFDATSLDGLRDLAQSRGTICALTSTGEVKCWGSSEPVELPVTGGGVHVGRTEICIVDDHEQLICSEPGLAESTVVRAAQQASMGSSHQCLVDPEGGIACWGDNRYGQLGDGSSTLGFHPEHVVDLEGVSAIAVAANSACALLDDGAHRCWGAGVSTPAAAVSSVRRLADGQYTAGCAIRASGGIDCAAQGWRGNAWDTMSLPSPGFVPVAVAVDRPSTVCAVSAKGSVKCLQSLGEGGVDRDWSPLLGVQHAVDIVALATGFCALERDGTVACYVDHRFDDDDDFVERAAQLRAHPVKHLDQVVDLAAGQDNVCARRRDGRVLCQGSMGFAREWLNKPAPTEVVGFEGASALAAHQSHMCAVIDGAVWCFGDNESGELGLGKTDAGTRKPARASLDTVAVDVGVGDGFTCALTREAKVACWGDDTYGQLGRGRLMQSETPVRVVGVGPRG